MPLLNYIDIEFPETLPRYFWLNVGTYIDWTIEPCGDASLLLARMFANSPPYGLFAIDSLFAKHKNVFAAITPVDVQYDRQGTLERSIAAVLTGHLENTESPTSPNRFGWWRISGTAIIQGEFVAVDPETGEGCWLPAYQNRNFELVASYLVITYRNSEQNMCDPLLVAKVESPTWNTQPFTTLGQLCKQTEWLPDSVSIVRIEQPIFEPEPETQGGFPVPLPVFDPDVPLPPPLYAGINCGADTGPPGPPGQDGQDGSDANVNIDNMITAVEEAAPERLAAFAISAELAAIGNPNVIAQIFRDADPLTAKDVGETLQLRTPIPAATTETRVVPGSTIHIEYEHDAEGFPHLVLIIPEEAQHLMQIFAYEDAKVGCGDNGGYGDEPATYYGIGVDAAHSTIGWQIELFQNIHRLLRCCNPCSSIEPYVEHVLNQPAWFNVPLLTSVTCTVVDELLTIDEQYGRPPIKKAGKFAWLYEQTLQTGREEFLNYGKQMFTPLMDARNPFGFAVIPEAGVTVKVGLFGSPPTVLTDADPHYEPLVFDEHP